MTKYTYCENCSIEYDNHGYDYCPYCGNELAECRHTSWSESNHYVERVDDSEALITYTCTCDKCGLEWDSRDIYYRR